MRQIEYRGGLVRFRIPDDWLVEEFEEGGGLYYPPGGAKSPTLRLNVITMTKTTGVAPASADEILRAPRNAGRQIERTSEGHPMIRYEQAWREEGVDLSILYWEIAQVVPPLHGRLVVFSLTTRRTQDGKSTIPDLVNRVDSEIRHVQLAKSLGETSPRKPWWQFW